MHRLPQMAELLLLFLLAWLVAGLWMSMPQQVKPFASYENTQMLQLPDPALLTKANLFGNIQPRQRPAQKKVPVVSSPLRIQLLGVIQAGEQSAAIIRHEGKQHVYFVGEQIQPGVTLHAVDADAIIIRRNGALEKVSMQKVQAPGGGSINGIMKMGKP